MRKEIIAIGILAMIAVCATLAIADTPPVNEIRTPDAPEGNKIVFLNFPDGSAWSIMEGLTEIGSGTTSPTGYAYFVTFAVVCPEDLSCNEVCIGDMIEGTHTVTVIVTPPGSVAETETVVILVPE